MKTIKKILAGTSIVAMLLAAAMLVGCGKNSGNTEPEATVELPVKTYETTIPSVSGTTTTALDNTNSDSTEAAATATETIATEPAERQYVPNAMSNVLDDTKLSVATIGGNQIDIADCTVKDLVDKAGVTYQSASTATHDMSDFYFYGKGFAYSMEGTTVFVEAMLDGKIVESFKEEEFEKYKIKGIKVSEFFSEESDKGLVSFCGGVRIGMTQEQVEAIHGKGERNEKDDLDESYFYKNATATMIVTYEKNENGVNIADDIHLIYN